MPTGKTFYLFTAVKTLVVAGQYFQNFFASEFQRGKFSFAEHFANLGAADVNTL